MAHGVRMGNQRGLVTIVWNAALADYTAMTEHGPPKTDMDSRSRLRKDKLRENDK
jgi:hypothetical protein